MERGAINIPKGADGHVRLLGEEERLPHRGAHNLPSSLVPEPCEGTEDRTLADSYQQRRELRFQRLMGLKISPGTELFLVQGLGQATQESGRSGGNATDRFCPR